MAESGGGAPPAMIVEKPGAQTSVQDSGRPGYLSRGIPAAGAQDGMALRVANLLVGNQPGQPPLTPGDPGAAGLECLMLGPTLTFTADRIVAVTGGRCEPKLDGQPVPAYRGIAVRAGQSLAIGPVKSGVRAYLAVSGGIEVPPLLGSRSTHMGLRQGGFHGRALRKGDRLTLGRQGGGAVAGRQAPADLQAEQGDAVVYRAVLGPQDAMFDAAALSAFLDESWKLLPMSNRMGFRFSGPRLGFAPGRPAYFDRDGGANPSNIVDDIIPLGGIQAPDGAALIAMGVEHPTAGGYAKIATLVTVDVGRLGQLRPGAEARFEAVTPERAAALGAEAEAALALWAGAEGASGG